MAASPRWKVYDAEGEYEGCAKHAEIAGAMVGMMGEGATIRDNHRRIVWREGAEHVTAAESVDACAETVYSRVMRHGAISGHSAPAI